MPTAAKFNPLLLFFLNFSSRSVLHVMLPVSTCMPLEFFMNTERQMNFVFRYLLP